MRNLLGIKNINCHSELDSESINANQTLSRISKFTAFIKKFNPLTKREGSVGGKCVVTPPEFLSSQSSQRNSTLPVQGGRKFAKAGFTLAGATHVGLPPIIAKAGFTLAEVLITLGIIGVVAAMTIPNLIQNIKDKETYTKLKATQSILSNAIRLAEEEYGDMSGWNIQINYSENDAKEIAKILKQYLKIALDCGTNDVSGHCAPAKRYIKLNGADHGQYHDNKLYYKVSLLNGTSVWWSSASQNSYKNFEKVATFFIDVNGPKLPNQIGRDLFIFPYEKGSLRPNGAPGHSEADTCILNSTGQSCTYFVLTNRHMKYPKN